MDVGLDRAFGPTHGLGDLGVGQAVDVAEDDGGSMGGGELAEKARPRLALVAPGERIGGRLRARIEVQLGGRNPVDARAVAAGVEEDRREPATEAELADPVRGPPGEGTVGADERVLDELLGVVPVAARPQGDREEAVLVGEQEGLEVPVEVVGEPCRERCVLRASVVHHVHETRNAGRPLHRPTVSAAGRRRDQRVVTGRRP
jgi:hypothetical protein